jgi:soluble lytic murein transglycosylase
MSRKEMPNNGISFMNAPDAVQTDKKAKTKRFFRIFIIMLLLVGLFTYILTFGWTAVMKRSYPKKYSSYVEKYCAEYNVDETLMYALIKTESGFDPEATSSVGAVGLTQIMPDTFTWLCTKTGEKLTEDDLKDPETSIKYCALFLSILQKQFSSRKSVIAAYHAGASKVSTWLADKDCSKDGKELYNIPSDDTAHYVNKVMNAINTYNNLYK